MGLSGMVVLALGAFTACTTHQGDTIVVNGLDCGLVRADLAGDWTVTYQPDSATLVNCDDPAWNGGTVDVTGATVIYYDVAAFAGASGATFSAVGAGPDLPNELIASVEADSCLSLVQTWEQDDSGWVQCVGTLDRRSDGFIGICDSFDLDSDGNGSPDVACDLSHSFTVTVATPT